MADAQVDLEALSDLCTPWCIRVAVTLRLAERIASGVNVESRDKSYLKRGGARRAG